MNQYIFNDDYHNYGGSSTSDHNNLDKSERDLITTDQIQVGTHVALLLLTLKNQIKVYHWQTHKYAEHVALDGLFAKLTKKNDEWVEVFTGKYGRIRFDQGTADITIKNIPNTPTGDYLAHQATALLHLRDTYFNQSVDSDLSNIFDEIIGHLYRTKYLLSLS